MLTKLSWLIFEKLNWLNLFSVCVYVFGIHVLKIVVESWFWELKMLIRSLVELHVWLHLYLCFSLLEKLFLSNLDSFSTLPWHLAIYRVFQLLFIAISIASQQLGGSIKISSGSSIASRQLLNPSRFFLHALFFTCFAYFFYLVIHSILFHYIHAFLWILCAPLIIFDHLYISRVKRSSFLYPLSIMTKRGRNCGNMWFLFKDSIF